MAKCLERLLADRRKTSPITEDRRSTLRFLGRSDPASPRWPQARPGRYAEGMPEEPNWTACSSMMVLSTCTVPRLCGAQDVHKVNVSTAAPGRMRTMNLVERAWNRRPDRAQRCRPARRTT